MKVGELIAKLQTFDADYEVTFYVEERDCERRVDNVRVQDIEVSFDRATRKIIKAPAVVMSR